MVRPVPLVRLRAALVGVAEGCWAGADGAAAADGAVGAAADGAADPVAVCDGAAVRDGAALPALAAASASDGSQAVSSRAEPAVIAETKATAAERRRRACADMDGSPQERWWSWLPPSASSFRA